MAQTGKEYYGYLFESDKKPTIVLDALLRGIANYIGESFGNKDDRALTPAKLASFYKAVGGNYDSLFVAVPNPSISWIYASIGCQHTLQPTQDDFQPPSVPALTTRGFVRWQSIEILLNPEEHVPFIQTAVCNFAIKNPDTGATFPVDLPTEAFPLTTDKEIERWHNSCAEKLRQHATPNEEDEGPLPDLPPRPKVRTGFSHVRPQTRDYFTPRSRTRPIPYQHVSAPGRPVGPKQSRSPTHQAHPFLSPDNASSPYNRGRRRSYPENSSAPSSPQPNEVPQPSERSPNPRRHSHPRHARRGSRSSDASSSGEGDGADDPPSPPHVNAAANVNYVPAVPATAAAAAAATGLGISGAAAAARRRSHPLNRNEPPILRFAPAPAPPTPTAAATPAEPQPRRRISRDRAASAMSEGEDAKRQPFTIPIDRTGKLSAPFLLGKRGVSGGRERRSENVTWKDLSGVQVEGWRRGSKSSGEEDRTSPEVRRRASRHDPELREMERDSGSSSTRRRRGRDDDASRPILRERRYSSQDDALRRHRDQELDYDRERESAEREYAGRGFKDRDRDRDRERERRGTSPVRGVDGRKYPPVRQM